MFQYKESNEMILTFLLITEVKIIDMLGEEVLVKKDIWQIYFTPDHYYTHDW